MPINWNGHSPDHVRPDVLEVLNQVAGLVDFPIVINSGYRDPETNRRAGGAKASQHMHGEAVDISLKGLSDAQRTQLTQALVQSGAHRIGAYSGNTALHVDMATKWDGAKGNYPVYPMFDRSIHNMGKAPDWFTAGLSGPPVPPKSIPSPPPIPATRTAQRAIDQVAPMPEIRPASLGYQPQAPLLKPGFTPEQRQRMGDVVSGSFNAVQPKATGGLYDGIFPLSQPLRQPPPIPQQQSVAMALQRGGVAKSGGLTFGPTNVPPHVASIDPAFGPRIQGVDVTPGAPPIPATYTGNRNPLQITVTKPVAPPPLPMPPIARAPLPAGPDDMLMARTAWSTIGAPPIPADPVYRINNHAYPIGSVYQGAGGTVWQATPGGFQKMYDPRTLGSGHNILGGLLNRGISNAQSSVNSGGIGGLLGALFGGGSSRASAPARSSGGHSGGSSSGGASSTPSHVNGATVNSSGFYYDDQNGWTRA